MASRFNLQQMGGIAPVPAAPTIPPRVPAISKVPLNPGAGGPAMNPGGGVTGAPISATNYNPAGRDVALRNLATQTPAAPTAAAPPPAEAPATDGGAPAPTPAPAPAPAPGAAPDIHTLVQNHLGDVQAFAQQLHSTTDKAARQQLIDGFRTQVQSWLGGIHASMGELRHDYRDAVDPTEQPGGFGNHWDQMEQQDQAAAPQPAADTSQGQEDAAAAADAQRIKRMRKSRLGGGSNGAPGGAGIYTGNGG